MLLAIPSQFCRLTKHLADAPSKPISFSSHNNPVTSHGNHLRHCHNVLRAGTGQLFLPYHLIAHACLGHSPLCRSHPSRTHSARGLFTPPQRRLSNTASHPYPAFHLTASLTSRTPSPTPLRRLLIVRVPHR